MGKIALKEKHISNLSKFIEDKIASSEVSKSGNTLTVSVPKNFTKQMLKLRLKKYLYISGLTTDFRLVSLIKDGASGYKIVDL